MSITWFRSKRSGKFRFRLVGINGRTIANSESYNSKQAMMKTIKRYWPRMLVERIEVKS